MIRIANARDDMTTTALSIGAIVVLAGSLAFLLFVHPPDVNVLKKQEKQAKLKDTTAMTKAVQDREAVEATIAAQTWKGDGQTVVVSAMNRIAKSVASHGLKLDVIRPQRVTVIDGGLQQLPFLVTVEGAFPDVAAFVKDMEAPEGRLATEQVQIASSDASTDKTTATVMLIAYLTPSAPPATTTTTTRTTTTTTTTRGATHG